MILKALTLENFKGIREPVRIEFAPLTLLFGPNNAGKSTIVQALMYAREVLEWNNCDAGRTQLGGDVIDLGGFENLVYGHDRSRVIRMRFELDLSGTENGLSAYSDSVRQHELEGNVESFLPDAPKKLDIRTAAKAPTRLVNVWVEIRIAWSNAQERPVIRTYSVGNKHEVYATISYDDALDRAVLSQFDFGVYPFGTRYRQGDATDFDWALECVARKGVRHLLEQGEIADLNQGARIQLPEEEEDETAKDRLSRQRFDALVWDIVQGAGQFTPSAEESDDEAQQAPLRWRQELIQEAESLVGRWSPRSDHSGGLKIVLGSVHPAISGEADGADDSGASASNDVEKPTALPIDHPASKSNVNPNLEDGMVSQQSEDEAAQGDDWEYRMEELSAPEVLRDQELESWLLELFVALIREGYVPTSPDDMLPLSLRGSALPEWKRTIEFDSRVWLRDKQSSFWETPAFAQEYLKDLLTTVITGPGERLLSALQQAIYVSPFREMPPRHYQPARSPAPRRWANGLAAWDWIMLQGKPFADSVNDWLTPKHRFGAGYAIDLLHYYELEVDHPLLTLDHPLEAANLSVESLRDQLRELPQGQRLQIRDLRNDVSLFPQDLGNGISQVVPVIVAALHNTKGVVAIEEPESNIHPAFQVVLADLFITQAKVNPDVMFLVETHSEHLMLRCLRRVRETAEEHVTEHGPSLVPEDIAVHFVEPSEIGPRIHRIRLDEDGEFMDPWPRGFFPERMKEIYGDDL